MGRSRCALLNETQNGNVRAGAVWRVEASVLRGRSTRQRERQETVEFVASLIIPASRSRIGTSCGRPNVAQARPMSTRRVTNAGRALTRPRAPPPRPSDLVRALARSGHATFHLMDDVLSCQLHLFPRKAQDRATQSLVDETRRVSQGEAGRKLANVGSPRWLRAAPGVAAAVDHDRPRDPGLLAEIPFRRRDWRLVHGEGDGTRALSAGEVLFAHRLCTLDHDPLVEWDPAD